MPARTARKIRKTAFSKSAIKARRVLRAAAPQGDRKLLRKSIGIRRGRVSHWVGLNVPQPGKRTKLITGKSSKRASNVLYYYKTLDQISARGAPLRPWFERAVNGLINPIGLELIEAAKNEIRVEAGRAHALSQRSNQRFAASTGVR